MVTNEQLKAIYPFSTDMQRSVFLPYLNEYMEMYDINTPERATAFLAQIGYESGQLTYTEEIASGKAYEGRRDLGNTFKGDGVKFKGRGLIQITGRSNYAEISRQFGIDLLANPQLLKHPDLATRSACWWWKNRKLNELADKADDNAFKRITRIINGGYNGYSERYKMWQRAKKVLCV